MATTKRTKNALPKGSSLLLKNNAVRVMDLRIKPGENLPMHTHPNDHLLYAVTSSKLKITTDKGKTSSISLKAGQIVWMKAESHAVVNVGKTLSHNLVIEVKK